MKEVYLVRHGESLQNREDLLSGVTDVPLSDIGNAQCTRLRRFFKKNPVGEVFASPLSRAIESANLIFPEYEILISEELIEFNYGEYEGVARSHDDEIMRQWNLTPAEVVFPGGKSVREHAIQVYKGFWSLVENSKAQRIACVSHRTTIRLMVAQVIGLGLNHFRLLPCSNCSVTVLHFGKSDFRLQSLNMELQYLKK